MLVDDITIKVKAGKGGDGTAAFNSQKMGLGPTGARGGNGGSIYFEGIADLGALNSLRNQKVFEAQGGGRGGRQLNDGPAGNDLVIKVPTGTVIHPVRSSPSGFTDVMSPHTESSVESSHLDGGQELATSNGIHNLGTGVDAEVIRIGERVLAAKGGNGGHGNYHFRGPHNTSPREFQPGKPGQEFQLRLELKLIADVGLIGLPNAGKSSLLNELTRANSKVANYAFTTLQPHLGAYYSLLLADIPGLIEGASEGKGLGIKFLRHVERTRILFHLVSAESEHPIEDYKTIRKELGDYNKALLEKNEFLFLSKTDSIDDKEAKKKLTQLKKLNPNVLMLSIHDLDSIKNVEKILNTIAEDKVS